MNFLVRLIRFNFSFLFLQLAPEQGLAPIEEPTEVKKKCDEEAESNVSQICQVNKLCSIQLRDIVLKLRFEKSEKE